MWSHRVYSLKYLMKSECVAKTQLLSRRMIEGGKTFEKVKFKEKWSKEANKKNNQKSK